jgi:hypothetical protein
MAEPKSALPERYREQLDDEVFRRGERAGRLTTSISMLTDALLMLNALELYYQKPASKSVVPAEIAELRATVDGIKELIRQALEIDRGPIR